MTRLWCPLCGHNFMKAAGTARETTIAKARLAHRARQAARNATRPAHRAYLLLLKERQYPGDRGPLGHARLPARYLSASPSLKDGAPREGRESNSSLAALASLQLASL